MAKNAELRIRNTINIPKVKKVSDKTFVKSQMKAAIQMLDWMSSGSKGSTKAPPIRTGILASSGSAFYKNKNIAISEDISGGLGTPNKSFNAKNITWGFNTSYATRMHEDKTLKPGPFSERNPNRHPGNQWMLEHLKNDKDNYAKTIALFMRKDL
jgi:hypothetical protein